MNKLYVIHFYIRDALVNTRNFWNEEDAENCMNYLSDYGWEFEMETDNEIHKIWKGK